jgi:hypothetical protein
MTRGPDGVALGIGEEDGVTIGHSGALVNVGVGVDGECISLQSAAPRVRARGTTIDTAVKRAVFTTEAMAPVPDQYGCERASRIVFRFDSPGI